MIDIKAFLEEEFSGWSETNARTLRAKILRLIGREGGEMTIGILFNRLRDKDRLQVQEELQAMQDEGLITATPQDHKAGPRTLVIRLASKT